MCNLDIIRLARIRSSRCWGRDALRGGHDVDGHLFVRVLLHRGGVAAATATRADAVRRSASLLLIDLAPPPSALASGGGGGRCRAVPSAAVRLVGQQLTSWNRVLSEITSAQTREATMRLSARDSELTKVVVPHIIGNTRTWLLPCVDARPRSIGGVLHLLQVAAAAAAAEITTACERTTDVVFADVAVIRPAGECFKITVTFHANPSHNVIT